MSKEIIRETPLENCGAMTPAIIVTSMPRPTPAQPHLINSLRRARTRTFFRAMNVRMIRIRRNLFS